MSDASPAREWRFYVEDMVAFCDKVLVYTHGLDRESFTTDTMRYDATLRNLELIGEAATHVPAEVRLSVPDGRGAWSSRCAIVWPTAILASMTTHSGAS